MKQTTRQSNPTHPRQLHVLFRRKMSCLRWDSNQTNDTLHSRQSTLPLSYQGSSAGWAQISHLIVHLVNRLTINEGEGRGNETTNDSGVPLSLFQWVMIRGVSLSLFQGVMIRGVPLSLFQGVMIRGVPLSLFQGAMIRVIYFTSVLLIQTEMNVQMALLNVVRPAQMSVTGIPVATIARAGTDMY